MSFRDLMPAMQDIFANYYSLHIGKDYDLAPVIMLDTI